MLRWQVPIVALSVAGLPAVFVVYLREIHVRQRIPAWPLALATAIALGLGVTWALVAGPIVAAAYTAALGGRMEPSQVLLCGIGFPATYAVTLLVPAATVRSMNRTERDPFDGFTIGAWSATIVNAAATATLLTPQLTMGVSSDSQSVGGLLGEAVIEGAAWPLGSMATGGIFGIALWMNPAGTHSRRYRKTVVIPAALLGALAFSVAMGVVDVLPLPLWPYIAIELTIAMATVVALRKVIAGRVVHAAGADSGETSVRCGDCGHGTYRGILGPLTAGIGLAISATFAAAAIVHPAATSYMCPPDCGRPPIGDPVQTNPRFSGDNGAYSVDYPPEGTAYTVAFNPPGIKGVQLRYTGGDTGVIDLFGEPAQGSTAMQIVRRVLADKFPGATVGYEIPNASVGYEPGYGVVADVYPRDSSITYTRVRVIVMAAIRRDYALIATAAGPYHKFSPDFGNGHPSGANLEVALDMGRYVNSFRWYGDPA